MKDNKKMFLDNVYIPELLKNISDETLNKRLAHELYTYASRALFYKRVYYVLSISTVIFPSLVTVINVFWDTPFSFAKLTMTIFSALSAIAAGILGIASVRDNWICYRSNCELLKEEIYKYISRVEPYNLAENEKNKRLFENKMFELYHNEASMWKKNNNT